VKSSAGTGAAAPINGFGQIINGFGQNHQWLWSDPPISRTSAEQSDGKHDQCYIKRDHCDHDEHECPIEAMASFKFQLTADAVFFDGFEFIRCPGHVVIRSKAGNGPRMNMCHRAAPIAAFRFLIALRFNDQGGVNHHFNKWAGCESWVDLPIMPVELDGVTGKG
jgi:hypothetical protein